MLKVLGRVTSINVRKVLWAAGEMGLSCEREDWGLPIRDPNVPEFLALNPNAQVPVIVDDGFVLWESGAVLRYLAARVGSDLWPADPRERAIVDQWLTWQATELNPSWGYAVAALLRKRPGYDDPRQLARSIAEWKSQDGDPRCPDRPARAVSSPTAGSASADIVLALSTHRWLSVAFDKPSLPAVEAHYAKMQSRPAGMAWLGATTP